MFLNGPLGPWVGVVHFGLTPSTPKCVTVGFYHTPGIYF